MGVARMCCPFPGSSPLGTDKLCDECRSCRSLAYSGSRDHCTCPILQSGDMRPIAWSLVMSNMLKGKFRAEKGPRR